MFPEGRLGKRFDAKLSLERWRRMNSKLLAFAALGLCLAASAPVAAPAKDRPITKKVLLITYNPVIESEGGRRLNEVCGWNDPTELTRGYIADLSDCSGGFVRYQVVQSLVSDSYPLKKDGFRYTDESYLQCSRARKGWHQPDAVDYHALIKEFDLERRVNRGEVDEVWTFTMPYSGYWESTMAGKRAYFCNSPPLLDVDTDRPFVIMGFNYERGVGEMLEDMGHRVESIMTHVYGSWDAGKGTHAWNRFTLYEKVAKGKAACGNVHFAPNSTRDYEWGSPVPVMSSADDWLTYPHLTGKKRLMTAADWGGGEIRAHHRWWLAHLPKAPGRAKDGKLANWWKYAVDFYRYPESR
jgi:hypothetical protein